MLGGLYMKKWLLTIVFGAALVLGACGGDDDADGGNDNGGDDNGDTEVSAGEEAYQNNCASCHGGNLEGVSGPALDTAGADHSADEIEDIIENGTGGMPPQPSVSDDDRTAIAEWLADKK